MSRHCFPLMFGAIIHSFYYYYYDPISANSSKCQAKHNKTEHFVPVAVVLFQEFNNYLHKIFLDSNFVLFPIYVRLAIKLPHTHTLEYK